MKKLLTLLGIILLPLVFAPHVLAQDSSNRPEKIVILEEDEVVDKDYFAAGDIVEIYGTVNGDVYAAAGQVIVDGTINGDLLLAGGDLRIDGIITQNVRVAGGQIKISGEIGRNVTAVGGNVDVTEGANIKGNLVAGTGNLVVDGTVGGDITAGTGSLIISGAVGGNVETGVGQLRITGSSTIDGNLTYWSEEDGIISDSSTVGGEVIKKETEAFKRADYEFDKDVAKPAGKAIFSIYKIFSFLAALIVGLLLIKFYPNYMNKLSGNLSKNAGRSFMYGVILLVGVPILSMILLVTLIGIPISFFLMFAYIVYIYLTKIFVSYWFGVVLAKKTGRKTSPYLLLILGMVIFYLLTLIPIIGGLLSLLSVIIGFGAAAITCQGAYNSAREKNIV